MSLHARLSAIAICALALPFPSAARSPVSDLHLPGHGVLIGQPRTLVTGLVDRDPDGVVVGAADDPEQAGRFEAEGHARE